MPKTLKDVLYQITFIGQYYTSAPKGENIHNYEVTVPMTQEQLDDPLESPLSLWKNYYAPILMPQRYTQYEALATFEVKSKVCNDPSRLQNNTKLMNFAELAAYIEYQEWDIKTELYDDAGSLRAAIESYKKDAEGFLKTQKIAEKRRGPTLKKQKMAQNVLAQFELKAKPKETNGKSTAKGKVKLPKIESEDEDDDDLAGM